MATVAENLTFKERRLDLLSGTARAHAIDRWIFVITALWFVAIVLTGFIPDSLMKIAAVAGGHRPPFPIVLHVHAALMGSFMLLLLTQTTLVATGRCDLHQKVGRAGMVLVPLLVLVGLVLVPTIYHSVAHAAQSAPPPVAADMKHRLTELDDIMLFQLRIGILFPLFLFIGLRARKVDSGLHKRMMILGTAVALPAAINRITWLPTTLPASPLSIEFYVLLAVSPMLAWDVIRNRRVHEAYWLWIGISLPFAILTYSVWDKPWWHSLVPQIMGV
jgi:uncharacterized membrane protein